MGTIVYGCPSLKVNTWRSVWPAAELRRRGYRAEVVGAGGVDRFEFSSSDVLIVHITSKVVIRPPRTDPGLADYVSGMQRHVRQVWLQADDDFRAFANVMDESWDRLKMALLPDLRRAMLRADGLIASTQGVADGYGDWVAGRKVVIRNWLPRWITELPVHRDSPPVAGWFGSGTHDRDLALLGDLRFRNIGDKIDKQAKLYRTVGKLSVGLAPLADDRWNRAKSWIKPLEYGAVGVPCVASNVGPYIDLWGDDPGFPVFLASSPEEFQKYTQAFLDGPSDGANLREAVRDHYTLEGRGGDEWTAWADSVL